MNLHRLLLGYHFHASSGRLVGGENPRGAIAAYDANAGRVRAAIGVEEQMHNRSFPVRRYRIEGPGRAAIPESNQVVAVADEDHGVIGPHVGIGLFLLGDRDAALAHCVQRESEGDLPAGALES